jgi:hypothetical protein
MVDRLLPFDVVIGEVALTVDRVAETSPAVTVTVAVWVTGTVLIVADTVFVPAAVELNIPVIWPLASVVPTGCVRVFPAVGVAASVTVTPAIGFPLASRAVTVIVLLSVPAPIAVGAALTVDCAAETPPAVTVTVAVCVTATVLIVADTVFVPAAVELRVPVICPFASVVPAGCVSVLPVLGLAASVTVAPAIGLPLASRAVTVIVLLSVPAPIDVGAALTVDCVAETPPAVTDTVAVCVIATVLDVAEIVFDSATVELSVPVATPLAFVVALGWVSVLPVPVAANTTVAP